MKSQNVVVFQLKKYTYIKKGGVHYLFSPKIAWKMEPNFHIMEFNIGFTI